MQTRDCLKRMLVYQPGKPVSEVKRELGLTHIVKLASNENPLGPSPLALQAISQSAEYVNFYPDGSSYYLTQKLAEHCCLAPENVALGNGSDELIRLFTLGYVNPGEEVINGDLSFITYRIATDLADGKNVHVPATADLRTNLAGILAAITKQTKLIFIDNPNNPTGTIVTKEEVAAFLEKVPANILVVFDEAYYEYIQAAEYPDTLSYVRTGRKNVAVLRTFSKIYGLAGLRVGYCLADKSVIENLNKVRCPFNISSLAQEAALASLADPQQIERSVANNEHGKIYLYAELNNLKLEVTPTYGNFILVKFPVNGREIFEKLLKKGIIVRPLAGYGLTNYLRISIGRVEENEALIKGLKEIL